MAQNVLDYSENPSGIQLMDKFLAGMAENQLTNHSGVSRPAYAQPGTFWIDTSATPWVLKQFTGSGDVVLGTLDQTGLVFTARRALQDGSGNTITSTYLKTTGTAARATADASGNVITSTYLKKTETASRATADGDGKTFGTTYSKINQPATSLTYSSTVSLLTNKIYTITLSGNVSFSLPQATSGVLNQIEVQLYMPSVYTINLGTTTYFGGEVPDVSEAGYYTIIYEYDNVHSVWVVGCLKKASA